MSGKGGGRRRGKGAKAKPGRAAHSEAEPQASLGRRIWDQVGPLLIAVGIALTIRAMVIESYYVPSESMLPTLLIGDHVFVNKFVYGAHVPLTDIALPAVRDPKRGEIVVFALGRRSAAEICPLDECPDYPAEGFVKRIVGLPGDRLEYRAGVFKLNGEVVPAAETGDIFPDESNTPNVLKREDLRGCFHGVLDHPTRGGPSRAAFTVPEGRYFLMGDNRDNSNDSRVWGTVSREHLKGPVLVNYWSWNNQETWLAMLNPLTWLKLFWSEMRWGRIGYTHGCEDA